MRSSARKAPDERRTLWIVLLLNAAIAVGFFATGLIGDSSALIANGVDNLSDLLVGLATSLIAVKGGIEILRDARAEAKNSAEKMR